MLPLQEPSLAAGIRSLAIGDNPAYSIERLLSQARSDNFDLKDFKFWAAQCQVLASQENYAETLAACERAIALKPNSKNRQIWFSRSNALLQLKRYAEAVNSYDFLLRFDAKNSLAWTRRGEALYQLGNYDEALASLEKALRVNGNWGNATPAIAWNNRGLVQRKLGQNETALASFDRALSINPDDAIAQVERCGTLSDLGRQEAAIEACDRAIDVLPAPALTNRAIAQQRAGKILDAIA
ncbi:MAG: tetratricopeptide repeat protein, partial [Microcoleus sp. SU_5_6]|nr:tetratricopeptide repeat protein [Microcoleus sp. SU_5_6]